MATYSRPGVFINEVALPQSITPAADGTARGAFLGAFAKGPITSPVLVTSWYEFAKTFGNVSDIYSATWGVYSFFANGGRQAYIKRVVGSGAEAASLTLNDRAVSAAATLTVYASSPGTWGNNLKVQVKSASTTTFNLIISETEICNEAKLKPIKDVMQGYIPYIENMLKIFFLQVFCLCQVCFQKYLYLLFLLWQLLEIKV